MKLIFFTFTYAMICLSGSFIQAANPGFVDEFERGPGALQDHMPGEWLIGGLASATIEENSGVDNSNGLTVATGDGESGYLHLPGADAWHPAIWKTFEAKLTPRSTDPVIDSDARCAFYVTVDGDIRARDGETWVLLPSGLDTSALHSWAMKLNFVEQTWKLWVDEVLITASPLGFVNAGQESEGLRFMQEGPSSCQLDNVAIDLFAPTSLVDSTDLADYEAFAADVDWQGQEAASGPGDDANGNGIANILEYALGVDNPAESTTPSPLQITEIDTETGILRFSFQRKRGIEDVALVPYFTNNLLSTWDPIPMEYANVTITEVQASPAVDEFTVSITLDPEELSGFLQLQIESASP